MTRDEDILRQLIKSVLQEMQDENINLSIDECVLSMAASQSELSNHQQLDPQPYDGSVDIGLVGSKILLLPTASQHLSVQPAISSYVSEQDGTRTDLNSREIMIAVGPAFAAALQHTVLGIPHRQIIRELVTELELHKLHYRIVRIFDSADLLSIAEKAYQLSDPGSVIALQSTGAIMLHLQLFDGYRIVEAFSNVSTLLPIHYRQIASYVAQIVNHQDVLPVRLPDEKQINPHYRQQFVQLYQRECQSVVVGKEADELQLHDFMTEFR